MKTNQNPGTQFRSHFIFRNLVIFYPITYMTEFLHADKTITEELKNGKSNQHIRG